MVVDTHVHFWRLEQFKVPPFERGSILLRDYLPQDLKPGMDGCGVQRVVAVQAMSSVEATGWLLELAKKRTYIGGVVGWVDLTSPNVGKTLEEFVADPTFKGVRHTVENESQPDWLIREDVLRGLGELARRDLTYDLLVRPHHLPQVLTVAERVPSLRMVVDHIAKPSIKDGEITEWARNLAAVAHLPSVYCKLSGMVTEADHENWTAAELKPYVDTALQLFGEDRVMYGSDWPVCQLAGSYGQVHGALVEALRPISPQTYAKIFGLNAENFYQLGAMEWSVAP